jgi:putative ABC transport system permease protein
LTGVSGQTDGTFIALEHGMDALLHDLRYAFRTLARTPTFTSIALLTLAIGTGANVTVFTFVSALLLRPAPAVSDPHSLISIFTSDYSSGPYGDTSYPDFLSLQRDATAFRGMAAEQSGAIAIVRTADAVERIRMSTVSGRYFEVLGLRAAVGRLITEADTAPAAPPVVVLGHDLWQRTFRSDPAIVGSVITVGGRACTIVGVAGERFHGLELGLGYELWAPLIPPPDSPSARQDRGLSVIARLREGVSLREAQSQVSTIAARLARDYPETNLGTLDAPTQPRPMLALRHTRLAPEFRGQVEMISAVILSAVGLVLIIACANVASLLLSRATARTREMAIRLALGASPWRVVRQLITESVLLGLGSGALGLLLSLWTADLLPSFFPSEQARLLDTSVDVRTFVFAAAVSLLSSILFGLAPALQAVQPLATASLRGESGRLSDGRAPRHLRRALVAGQVAVAVVLLVSAALLVRSLSNQLNADLGFGTRQAVLAFVDLPHSDFTTEQRRQYFQAALERIRHMPSVVSASFTRSLPLSGRERRGFRVEGYTAKPGEDRELNVNVVDEQYFRTMQIPILAGREFDSRDRPAGVAVAVVNDALADRYFGGRALGKRLTDSSGKVLEIVGVVRSSRHRSMQEGPLPVVYYPLSQSDSARMTLIARTSGNPLSMIEPVRQQLIAVNRGVPVYRSQTMASHLSEVVAADRLTAALVGICGAMALLLAAIGVYGVIAYSVVRRTREIGVRVALGARPTHIIRLVLAEGLSITAVGIVLGLGVTFAAARGLASMLYGVSSSDVATYATVPALLAAVAVLAALGPARRALNVEPVAVLRQE